MGEFIFNQMRNEINKSSASETAEDLRQRSQSVVDLNINSEDSSPCRPRSYTVMESPQGMKHAQSYALNPSSQDMSCPRRKTIEKQQKLTKILQDIIKDKDEALLLQEQKIVEFQQFYSDEMLTLKTDLDIATREKNTVQEQMMA